MSGDNDHQTIGFIINRILVPFDNSPLATRAFVHALSLAKKFGASILLISIIQDEFKKSWTDDTLREKDPSKKQRVIFKDGAKVLQNLAQKFNVSVEHELVVSRNIAESITTIVTSKKIDCVVMGTRGKGMRKEMMLGRVSTSVAVNANCPVVLVK